VRPEDSNHLIQVGIQIEDVLIIEIITEIVDNGHCLIDFEAPYYSRGIVITHILGMYFNKVFAIKVEGLKLSFKCMNPIAGVYESNCRDWINSHRQGLRRAQI